MWKQSIAVLLVSPCLASAGPVRSGHATVEWVAGSETAEPGSTLQTAIELAIDPHWHTYWVNPGEAGVATSVVWQVPEGWKVGPLCHPAPKRFLTGELIGYGHEGRVLFPVELGVPEDFSGSATLNGTVTWLSCNDQACVPGEAAVRLIVSAGKPSDNGNQALISKAFASKPKPGEPELRLVVEKEDDQHWAAMIEGGPELDLAEIPTFVETPDTVDPKSRIQWTKAGNVWAATLTSGPYAPARLENLSLLLVPDPPARPVRLEWQK